MSAAGGKRVVRNITLDRLVGFGRVHRGANKHSDNGRDPAPWVKEVEEAKDLAQTANFLHFLLCKNAKKGSEGSCSSTLPMCERAHIYLDYDFNFLHFLPGPFLRVGGPEK